MTMRRAGCALYSPDRERLIALARPRGEVLGVLALIDPSRTAGRAEISAIEHAAIALGVEPAYQRRLAEAELRLRGDLVDDLITVFPPSTAAGSVSSTTTFPTPMVAGTSCTLSTNSCLSTCYGSGSFWTATMLSRPQLNQAGQPSSRRPSP